MLTPSLESKLDSLAEYTRDLREIQPHNLEAFRGDKMLRRYAERMLQMAIESSIHIGVETLALAGFREPENYHDIFTVLGDHSVLSPQLVTAMTMLVELRNLLIYEQDGVDDTTVYGALKKRVDDLEEYGLAIRAFAKGEPFVPSLPFGFEVAEGDD
ncbi:MAG: type VII toxin-antitoxin system HepT family RNase toxin [Rudaea sp.]